MSSTPTTDEPTITEIDWTDHYDQGVDSSLYDATYTYSNDKYSCVQGFYFAHLVFNWFVFLSGVACLITRLVPARFKYLHSWFGRIYILSMLWSTTTSLLMNNTGLPLSTLISFAAVMGCLSVGWIVIIFHKQGIEKAAQSVVQQKLLESAKSTDEINLGEMMGEAKMEVVDSKTFVQRFFSLKALHGILFFVSWMQIAGRIFNSNQSGDFTCHTYPVYKPIDVPQVPEGATDELTLVPVHDPDWESLPWSGGVVQWTLSIIFGSMAGAVIVGAILSYYWARKAHKKREGSIDDADISTKDGRHAAGIDATDDGVPAAEKFADEEESTSNE
mmetsp:Transcript_26302/g.57715  ORF Transcript_26302/g.57715 Transcript_26302/m.57715 type:complete len:331 (+) Transcript_26302:116-1108(+)|eukprot:CAMPEP_0178482846 /NCGR_PEP_ID=MMETSP0696-20121128/6934_1 /TAXON_ID=265572 /ORGANISM="Extubocellulus spinifer, Strain CCMP396" /LENGTH=330 /DNA_ID=CAMNT_0020110355 /DNA_START=126 /DNA_END=1118 /DNA_ORIENTATION=+